MSRQFRIANTSLGGEMVQPESNEVFEPETRAPERALAGMRVAILATHGVEEAELTEPRKALDEAGARTALIAPKGGRVRAMKHDQPGGHYDVEMTLDQANPEEFDAVLLPGG